MRPAVEKKDLTELVKRPAVSSALGQRRSFGSSSTPGVSFGRGRVSHADYGHAAIGSLVGVLWELRKLAVEVTVNRQCSNKRARLILQIEENKIILSVAIA